VSADQIGFALKGRRNGNGWLVRCPVPSHGKGRGDRSPSLSVSDGDDGRLLAKCFARCSFEAILDSLRNLGLVDRPSTKLSCERIEPRRIEPNRPQAGWRSIWSETVSALGTAVEAHLTSRKLSLPNGHEDVLRFHPSCPFGPGVRHPCMVALFRDIRTNEPSAIHRTALTPDGEKIGRMSLGAIGGCAIKLTPDEDVAEGLTIAEGIETAIAGMALNFRPAWALGSAGGIAKFPVLSGIECLTILVDNDASGTGQETALDCSQRWTRAGREVFRVVPTAVGQDMADIIRGRAA
jgi:putative DNA primase/helicase